MKTPRIEVEMVYPHNGWTIYLYREYEEGQPKFWCEAFESLKMGDTFTTGKYDAKDDAKAQAEQAVELKTYRRGKS